MCQEQVTFLITKVFTQAAYIVENSFLPAKPVRHDAHAEGAHHTAHTEDGDGDTPDDGTDPGGDGLAITLDPGIVEERS